MTQITSLACPICEKEIMSDATITNYCKLCGMNIENSRKEFCCSNCKNKFNEFVK